MEGQQKSLFVEMKWRISGRVYWAAALPKTWEAILIRWKELSSCIQDVIFGFFFLDATEAREQWQEH